MTEMDQRPLANGEVIDGYRIERVLGSGGFGITYLATDISLNRQVAIKEYFPQNAWRVQESRIVRTNDGDAKDTFKLGLDRFYKEGQILAQFKHPNIVGVQRIVETNDTAYLVMDYEHGETLDAYMHRLGRPLSYKEASIIFNPLLDGLRAIHDRGLLHLDIKPANIFLRSDDSPVLIDFGGARHQLGQASRLVSFLVASDGYAPNEQYTGSGQHLKPITDIYAMGATLYFCLTNQIPADAQIRANALIDNQPDPLIPLAQLMDTSEYPENFLETVEAALSMRTLSRPQSVREFQQRLFHSAVEEPAIPLQPVSQPQSHIPQPVITGGGTNWTPALLTVGLIITLLLAGILWSMTDSGGGSESSMTQETITNLENENAVREAQLKKEEEIRKLKEQQARTKAESDRLKNLQEQYDRNQEALREQQRKTNERLEAAAILAKQREDARQEKLRNQCIDNDYLTSDKIRILVSGKTAFGTRTDVKKEYDWKEYQSSDGTAYFRKTNGGAVSTGKWKVEDDTICWCYGSCSNWKCKRIEPRNNCSNWYYIDSDTHKDTGKVRRWSYGDQVN